MSTAYHINIINKNNAVIIRNNINIKLINTRPTKYVYISKECNNYTKICKHL